MEARNHSPQLGLCHLTVLFVDSLLQLYPHMPAEVRIELKSFRDVLLYGRQQDLSEYMESLEEKVRLRGSIGHKTSANRCSEGNTNFQSEVGRIMELLRNPRNSPEMEEEYPQIVVNNTAQSNKARQLESMDFGKLHPTLSQHNSEKDRFCKSVNVAEQSKGMTSCHSCTELLMDSSERKLKKMNSSKIKDQIISSSKSKMRNPITNSYDAKGESANTVIMQENEEEKAHSKSISIGKITKNASAKSLNPANSSKTLLKIVRKQSQGRGAAKNVNNMNKIKTVAMNSARGHLQEKLVDEEKPYLTEHDLGEEKDSQLEPRQTEWRQNSHFLADFYRKNAELILDILKETEENGNLKYLFEKSQIGNETEKTEPYPSNIPVFEPTKNGQRFWQKFEQQNKENIDSNRTHNFAQKENMAQYSQRRLWMHSFE